MGLLNLRGFGRGVRAWLALVAIAVACGDGDPDAPASAGKGGSAGSGKVVGGAAGETDGAGMSGDGAVGGRGGSSGSSASKGGRGGAGRGGASSMPSGAAGEGAASDTGGSGGTTGGTSNVGDGGMGAGQGGTGAGGPAPDPGAATRLATAVAQCNKAGTEAVVEALARAGIETIDNVSGDVIRDVTPPVRGLHVWLSQASAMACDLANGSGLRGTDLDEMVGQMPLSATDSVDFSWFLAVYVTLEDGPFGSQLAAELFKDADVADHATLVYPTLVITLFMREVVLPTLVLAEQEKAAPRVFTRNPSRALAAADPCAAIADFLDDLPQAVEGAIGGLVEDEDSIWGVILGGVAKATGLVAYVGAEAARQALKHLPGMDAFKTAMTAWSAVSDIRSLFTNWALTVDSSPGTRHKPVGGTATGQFILTVEAPEPGSDWPAPLKSCADLLGIPLPNFNGADGSSVSWELKPESDPISYASHDPTVAGTQATMTFNVVSEPAELHLEGICELETRPKAIAQLGLPGLESLGSTISGFIGSPPATTGISVGAAAAAKLLGPSKDGTTEVTYHPKQAKLDLDNPLEQIHLTSSNGVGPDSTWTGTWGHQSESTGAACGPPDSQPATIQFSGGIATHSASYMQSGGIMLYCSYTFAEQLVIQADTEHAGGCMFQELNGNYSSSMKPPDPAGPLDTSGIRDGSFGVTLVSDY